VPVHVPVAHTGTDATAAAGADWDDNLGEDTMLILLAELIAVEPDAGPVVRTVAERGCNDILDEVELDEDGTQ
jgi:hypothetical protein